MAKKVKSTKPKRKYVRREGSNPPGHPSLYKPEFCEEVLELGKAGMTPAQIAAEFGVHRSTIRLKWCVDHPEFKEAYDLALQYAQAEWERRLDVLARKGGRGDGTKASAIMWLLQRRFRQDYHDKFAVEHSGPDGGPIETAQLTHEQLMKRAKELGLPTKIFED